MGNGRATTNIRPEPAPAEARVLGNGTIRGASKARNRTGDGRIVFRTGMTYGNAVIGLRQPRVCIWSWHICRWITISGHGPDLCFGSRLYGSQPRPWLRTAPGRRHSIITSGAAAIRSRIRRWPRTPTRRLRTVYAPGFEYAESNPRTSGTESPYDVMTLEWATAHPTTYMDGVFTRIEAVDVCRRLALRPTSGATSRPRRTISAAPAINPFT